ncbi:MAG: hypothetical protein ACP5OA_07265 [Candidatus Woesearchaeota archaeon]
MDSKGLLDAVPEKTFYLFNGKPISNLAELVSELEIMTNDDFAHHCNEHKDDFSIWIDDALRLHTLAATLNNVKDKDTYINIIKDEIYPKPGIDVNNREEFKEESEEVLQKELLKKEVPLKILVRKEIKSKAPKSKAQKSIVSKSVASNTIPVQYSKDLTKLKMTIEGMDKIRSDFSKKFDETNKTNSELWKKIDSMDKINSELNKKIDTLTKINADLNKKLDETNKVNSELGKKVDNVDKASSELRSKTDILSKNVAESPVPNLVAQTVSKYFEDEKFKNKIIDTFKQTISDLHSKDRIALKTEINNIMSLNDQLDKKLETSLNNRAKQIDKLARTSVSNALNEHLAGMNNKIDKIMESRISKSEKLFDKKAENISSINLTKFKNDILKEKHDLRAIASEAMHKEFDKVFNSDEHLSKIVTRYQKMFAEGAENAAKMHKDSEDKFNDEMAAIKDKTALECQGILNKQLVDTIKKQRELLDTEIAKALSSNKYFVSRFEKEVISREKMLLESADRKLVENYKKHDSMLRAEFDKYTYELRDLKLQLDNNFKSKEAQFMESINTRIHEALNKEFNDILVNQRNELSEIVSTIRINAINKVDTEFNELLSKHKQFLLGQFNKAGTEQSSLKEKFIAELKSEEEKIISKVRDLMKKELASTLTNHRDLMDKELTKTVLANKYFVERFEKEIIEMNKQLTDSGNKLFEENYSKHNRMIQASYDKQLESLKKIITDANNDIDHKESKIYSQLNAIIPASVRESVNKEFSRLILDEKKALEVELIKAKETNNNVEKKFEGELQEKAQAIVDKISADASAKFNEVVATSNARFNEVVITQQSKLEEELLRAKKSFEEIEDKKKDLIEKANSIFDDINEDSVNKLKDLEREHGKHLKKVSQITTLITKTESALTDLKELKAQITNDKKAASKDSKEYSQLMSELTELRNNLSKEKTWIAAYRTKTNVYNMIHKCSECIKSKDVNNAKLLYNKIVEVYTNTPFEENDRVELYNAATVLLKDIQNTFGTSVKLILTQN